LAVRQGAGKRAFLPGCRHLADADLCCLLVLADPSLQLEREGLEFIRQRMLSALAQKGTDYPNGGGLEPETRCALRDRPSASALGYLAPREYINRSTSEELSGV